MAESEAEGSYSADPVTLAIVGGLVAWLGTTAASNLPLREFDRLRRGYCTAPLVPNWRFFAPRPIAYDFEVIYRTRAAGEADSCWRVALAPTPRRWIDAVWMPVRRRDKALMDIVTDLPHAAGASRAGTAGLAHAMLTAAVAAAARREIRGNGDSSEVQFAVLKHDGYLGGGRRLVYLSDFSPVTGESVTAAALPFRPGRPVPLPRCVGSLWAPSDDDRSVPEGPLEEPKA